MVRDVHVSSLTCAGLKTLAPAVQYLAGELAVERGTVLPLRAAHNTVAMRWDVEEADYLNLAKPDAAFPPHQFAMLADSRRNEVRRSGTGHAYKWSKDRRQCIYICWQG